MASEQVGEAHVDIHVNASPAEAELDAFMAKSDRDFAEFGRKKAEATLGLKAADFDKQIDEAKGKLDEMKGRRATATLDLAKKHFDEEVAAAKAQLDALSKKKATITVETRQVKAAHKELSMLGKEQELNEKRSLGQAKAEQKLSQERSKATTEAFKQRAELSKLSDEYEKLKGRQEKLEKSSRGVFSPHSVAAAEKERRAISRVGDELEFTKHKIESMGGSVEGLDSNVSKNSSLLDKWASRLGDTSIRVGPLTTSIKGLATGVGLLGPMLFDLAGGAADVIGFLGAGIAGAASVGAAGLAGFATSALGVGLVIRPMVKEFGEAKKASEALAKAELKYGKGSSQVKTAQEEFNHTLKGVSPIAKEAFESYGKLGGEWRKLTSAAKPAVFEAFGQGLKTVQALLPEFASEATKTTEVAGKAWDGWMKALRSNGAKQALGEVMSNFRASIPGIASGLESIGATLGHIAAAASHFLPGLSHGFAEWAANLEKSVGSGKGLQSTIGGLVHDMSDFGHLAQSSGSFLVHFFGDAASSGDELNNSLTKTIQSWDKGIQTPKGKESLTNYFHESADATKDFFSVIGGASKLLFEFSQATAPVANGLLHIVTFLGQLVSAADEIAGVKTIFQALGGVLAGLWVVGKVQGYMGAIQGVLVKLGLMSGVTDEAAASEAALTAAITANTAAQEANAAATADAATAMGAEGLAADAAAGETALAGVATEAEGVGVAATGAADGAGILAAALAPEILIPAGAAAALAYFSTQVANNTSVFEEAEEASREAEHQLHHAAGTFVNDGTQYNNTLHKQATLNQQVKAAQENTIAVQKKYGVVSNQALKAQQEQLKVEQQQIAQGVQAGQQRTKSVQAAKATLAAAEANIKAAKEERKAANEKIQGSAGNPTEIYGDPERSKHLAEARKREAQATHEAAIAARELTVAEIPLERQNAGLAMVSEKTERGLRTLSKTIGAAATKKIGNFVDPNAVSKITTLSNKLTKLGQGTQVKNIDVKSKGADQTINKLQQLQKQTGKVTGGVNTLTVKSNDTQANQSLRRVASLSQKLTGSAPTIKILANANNAEQAVQQIMAHLRTFAAGKYQAVLSAQDHSGAARDSAYHHAREFASQKYEAILTAADRATAPLRQAINTAKQADAMHPQIPITATNQASATIQEVIGEINAISSEVHPAPVIVPVTYKATNSPPSGTRFAGGPSAYMSFAAGGVPTDRELQLAADRAVRKESGRGGAVKRPTMLVGEQAPSHNEYVITENPAYRTSNERYLDQAAGALGRELVPAYRAGSGGNSNQKKQNSNKGNSGGNSGGNSKQSEGTPPTHNPPGEQKGNHSIVKVTRWGPVTAYNRAETDIGVQEGKYNAERQREELNIQKVVKAGGHGEWNWNVLRGFLQKEKGDRLEIKNLVPKILSTVEHEEGRLGHLLDGNGTYSQNAEKGITDHIANLARRKNKLERGEPKAPTKGSKTTAEYSAAKATYAKQKVKYEGDKENLEHEEDKAKKHLQKVEKERTRLAAIRVEANEEKRELTQSKGEENETSLKEVETSLETLSAEETGELGGSYPGYEEPESAEPVERGHPNTEPAELALIEAENRGLKGAELTPFKEEMLHAAEKEFAYDKSTPGIQDDIEGAGEIRSAQNALEESKTGNGEGGASAAEQTATVNAARQQLYEQFASNITNAPPSGTSPMFQGGGSPSYAQSGLGSLAPTPGGGASTSGGAPGTVNNVVNNFAAPPPDAHTFSANLQFELNA